METGQCLLKYLGHNGSGQLHVFYFILLPVFIIFEVVEILILVFSIRNFNISIHLESFTY